MKHFLIALLLTFLGANAQVQKLSQLSTGKFIDSAVIMEEDDSDVFGYCILYEKDRKSSEIFELEYVILDKNLNRLTSVKLLQAAFKTWMARTYTELTFVKKIDNQLIISVNESLKNPAFGDLMTSFNYRYINLNLENFTFSKEYKYENFSKKEFEHKAGDNLSFGDFWNLQKLTRTNSRYILAFATPEYNPQVAAISNFMNFDFKREKSVKRFAILDKDLKEVWAKDINTDSKTACRYEYLDSDTEVLLLQKIDLIKKERLEMKSIEAYDIKSGRLLGEILLNDKDYKIGFYDVSLVKDKIHVFTNAYNDKGNSVGYGHIAVGKNTLKEASRNFMLWKNLASVVPGVNETAEIEKTKMIFAQDFIVNAGGNILMIAEAYLKKPVGFGITGLENMYLIEFDKEGSVVFSKVIEKKNSVKVPAGLSAMNMRNYGFFDYRHDQKINNTSDFVLFYRLNDQSGNSGVQVKKPLWTLGMISYVDGQYGEEKLPLYGDDVRIAPGLAKNGYVRLLEINEKTDEAELRLEKINY